MSKGGSTSSTVEVPEYIEKAAQRNLNQADLISKLGFIPEYGPTVAAFTPSQEAAFQGTAQAAGAFGLPGGDMSMRDISGGMPEPTTYAGGVRGYSSLPIYEQALEAFGEARPGQKRYVDSFFIDPVTGLPGSNMQAPVDYTVAPTPGDLGGISCWWRWMMPLMFRQLFHLFHQLLQLLHQLPHQLPRPDLRRSTCLTYRRRCFHVN